MRSRIWGVAFALASLSGSAAARATVFPEVENNETKALATVVTGMVPGDSLTGTTTGTASTAGATSRDFFKISLAPTAPGLYRYQLALNVGGSQANTGAIMGTAQSGAASDTTTVQTTGTTTPPRMVQWYGFGKGESLYYRVQGATATTAAYQADLSMTPVAAVDLGSFQQGSFTLSTFGQTTTDTEMFLYDGNYNLLRSNDDVPAAVSTSAFQSQIVDSLLPGVHYLAISSFNTATNAALESVATERSTTGNRLDFPDMLVRGSTAGALSDLDFTIDTDGDANPALAVSASAAGGFDVYWAKFTVVPEPATLSLLAFGVLGMIRRRR